MPPPTARRRPTIVPHRGTRPAGRTAPVSAPRIEATEGEAAPERKAVVPSFSIGPVRPVAGRPLNMMVYGPYGHGKTTLAGSAEDVPAMRDVLFINAESGDMSLTNHRSLDVININKYKQLARIFEYLTLHCRWRDEGNIEALLEHERQLKSTIIPVEDQTEPVEEGRTWFEEQRLRTGRSMDEPFMYRTVILDSISELHKYLVYQFTGIDVGKAKLDIEVEKMEEWQVAQEMFRLLVRSFRDLPMNVIFVSAEAIEPEQRNKRRNPHAGQALPKLAGQMAADIAGFIDIVGYLVRDIGEDGETTRRLYLGAGYEGWISKHRFENLPDLDYVENPTLASLIELARKDAEYNGHSEPQRIEVSTGAPSGRRPVTAATQRGSRPRAASPGRSRR